MQQAFCSTEDVKKAIQIGMHIPLLTWIFAYVRRRFCTKKNKYYYWLRVLFAIPIYILGEMLCTSGIVYVYKLQLRQTMVELGAVFAIPYLLGELFCATVLYMCTSCS